MFSSESMSLVIKEEKEEAMDVHRPSLTNAFFSLYFILFMTTVQVKKYDKPNPELRSGASLSLF